MAGCCRPDAPDAGHSVIDSGLFQLRGGKFTDRITAGNLHCLELQMFFSGEHQSVNYSSCMISYDVRLST